MPCMWFPCHRHHYAVFNPLSPRHVALCPAADQPCRWPRSQEMRAKEAMLRNFFQNVEAATRDSNISSRPLHMQQDDLELLRQIQEAQQQVGRQQVA